MIRHLAKLVWSRKRKNALVVIEIFVSFLVVFAVVATAAHLADNARRPLGFDWRDVWRVHVDLGRTTDDVWDAEESETMARVLREAESLPEVRSAAVSLVAPFEMGGSEFTNDSMSVAYTEVSDGFPATLDLELVAGRFFDASDDGALDRPIVVDLDLAREAFGGDPAEALGRRLELGVDTEYRVVGVMRELRRGELSSPANHMLVRQPLGDPRYRPGRRLLLELAPGVDAGFAETLLERLQAVAPAWGFEVEPLARLRDKYLRFALAPLALGALVAGFLLVMVALGLFGVLWQDVTHRREEIGLRRALGADGAAIRRQVLAEVTLLAALGVAAGVVVALQLPVLDLLGRVRPGVFAVALAGSVAAMLALAALCGLYPSWLATRVEPATALMDE